MDKLLEKLLTPEQVADALGVKRETLYAWTHYRKIPFVKVGLLVRFRPSEIDAWLSKSGSRNSPECQGIQAPKTKMKAPRQACRAKTKDDFVTKIIASTLK